MATDQRHDDTPRFSHRDHRRVDALVIQVRRHGAGTNPIVDPAAAARAAPVASTAQACNAAVREALAQEQQQGGMPAGKTKRTSFGTAVVRPDGQVFVRAGQVAEASGAASQLGNCHAGAHVSAPFGVTPETGGTMSYATTASASHGADHWNDTASMAGRIAQRRLQGGRRRAGSNDQHQGGTLTVHSVG